MSKSRSGTAWNVSSRNIGTGENTVSNYRFQTVAIIHFRHR